MIPSIALLSYKKSLVNFRQCSCLDSADSMPDCRKKASHRRDIGQERPSGSDQVSFCGLDGCATSLETRCFMFEGKQGSVRSSGWWDAPYSATTNYSREAAQKERSWRGNMGCESTAASPGVKRGRDPEEEVYLDNLHSHKRYLSEIMASSLNGLTVGDSLAENLREYPTNLRESPARSESISYFRDDTSPQYSPMSEDSEDSRYCDTPTNSTSLQTDFTTNPTSPVSPHRNQRLPAGPVAVSMYPLPSCTLSTVVCSHPRQRGSDTDSRFPSSPNDVCHTADLRKAALLRSVQIRTQGEERPFSGSKTLEDDGDYIEDCSSVDVLNESKLDGDQ